MSPADAPPLPPAFWRQWWASAVSNLGDGITFVAMPLLAFALTEDERLLALTAFATLLPWLLLALPVGVLVDRFDRRGLMIAANVIRFVLYAVLAYGATTGSLSIWILLGLLVVVGACEVVFDSTAQAFLPAIVPATHLARANGYLFAAEVVLGSMVGIAAGALLFQGDPGLPFGINAFSFAAAAVLIASIRLRRPRSTVPARRERMGPAMAAGWRWLRGDSLLLTLAVLLAVTNVGLMMGQGVFVKYAAVELGVGTAGYGALLLSSSLGAALGGLVGHRVLRRIGTTLAIGVPYLVFGVGQLMFAVVPVAWVVAVSGFAVGAAITTWNVVTVSLRQRIIPSELFGRVNSVYRWLGTGASAFGALVGGQLAYHLGLRVPYLIAGMITLAALVVGAAPVRDGIRRAGLDERHPAPATPAPPSIT